MEGVARAFGALAKCAVVRGGSGIAIYMHALRVVFAQHALHHLHHRVVEEVARHILKAPQVSVFVLLY
jgi:hypothetical protein